MIPKDVQTNNCLLFLPLASVTCSVAQNSSSRAQRVKDPATTLLKKQMMLRNSRPSHHTGNYNKMLRKTCSMAQLFSYLFQFFAGIGRRAFQKQFGGLASRQSERPRMGWEIGIKKAGVVKVVGSRSAFKYRFLKYQSKTFKTGSYGKDKFYYPTQFYLLLSSYPTNTNILTPSYHAILLEHDQFYRNQSECINPGPCHKSGETPLDQENHESMFEVSPKNRAKTIDEGRAGPKNQEYHPKRKPAQGRKGKVYEKDKQRNILPNSMSKLFFFLKSSAKSQNLLAQILQNNANLSRLVTPSKYYTYQNLLKSRLGRFMTEDSLKYLFCLVDQELTVFSREEQLAFIRVNAIMLRNYFGNCLFFQYLMSSSRTPKQKIPIYIKKFRKIQQAVWKYARKAMSQLDFTILDKKQSS